MLGDFDATLLKVPCGQLIEQFQARGVKVGRSNAHELIAAALGFWTYKLAREHGAPIIQFREPGQRSGPNPRHLAWVTERVERICDVDTWTAQALALVVVEIVRAHALYVDALAVLHDVGRDDEAKKRLFKAIDDPNHIPHVDPIRATAAIGRGLLPMPQARTFDQLLEDAGPQMWNLLAGPQNAAWLWLTPPTTSPDAHHAWADSYRAQSPSHAELGCRLSVISTDGNYRVPSGEQIYLVTSTLLRYRDSDAVWTLHHPRVYGTMAAATSNQTALEQQIQAPLASLPQLVACHRCLSVHLAGGEHRNHQCMPRFDGHLLGHAVDRAEGRVHATYVRADHLLDEARGCFGPRVTQEELDSYVAKHAQALRLRPVDGGWIRTKPPAAPRRPFLARQLPSAAGAE